MISCNLTINRHRHLLDVGVIRVTWLYMQHVSLNVLLFHQNGWNVKQSRWIVAYRLEFYFTKGLDEVVIGRLIRSSTKYTCVTKKLGFLPTQCYASAGTRCGPVSVSATSRCSIKRLNESSKGASFHLSYTVLKRHSHIFRNKGNSLWYFVQNFRLRKFCFDISIVEKCYRLSSTKVGPLSVKLDCCRSTKLTTSSTLDH